MPKTVKASPKRGRGRPRDLAAKAAILSAARELLDAGGPGAVTMEAVALRAGVGKPTVYRWWPDRHAVVMEALMSGEQAGELATREGPSALEELRAQLKQIAQRFATPTGRLITSMIAAADPASELTQAFRGHFVMARRSEGRSILERGMASGEFRSDLDVEIALDGLYGAVFFRLLMGHAPLDAAFVDSLLEQALKGLSPASRARRPAPR